jgi:F-type H+-transporting ATPase subunit epsilon
LAAEGEYSLFVTTLFAKDSMAEGFKIDIVSPEKLVLSETVQSVTVPGTEGYFTVMAGHAPFMSTLRPGFVTVVPESGSGAAVFYVQGGFADVSPAGLTLLAEEASDFKSFDHEALQVRIREAQEALDSAALEDKNYAQQWVSALLNLADEAKNLHGAHIV